MLIVPYISLAMKKIGAPTTLSVCMFNRSRPLPPARDRLYFCTTHCSNLIKTSATYDTKDLVNNQTDVSLGIAKAVLLNQGKNSNLVFSPLSIHVALSVIAAGSEGRTLDHMLSFLKSKTIDELYSFSSEVVPFIFASGNGRGGPRFSFANGVWFDKSLSFKHAFKQVLNTVFRVTLNQVDFRTKAYEVTKEVNSWIEKETNGLIKNILPSGSVESDIRLIFANALYFKGVWNEELVLRTEDYDYFFHLLNEHSVKVPFLTSRNQYQFISAFDGFKVLGLPYEQGGDQRRFSMYFFLPDAKDGLSALVEKVASEFGFLDRHLPRKKVRVRNFRIPKFKFSFGFEATGVLKGLGLVLPFSRGEDLSRIGYCPPENGKFFVSNIFHKAFIEVNGCGTEAAAATVTRFRVKSAYSPPPPDALDFVADHPFLFLIREETSGVVLFIGQVLNPLVLD